MASANTIIVRDPETLHGAPAFRGTRVPLQALFDSLEGGETLEEFLEISQCDTRDGHRRPRTSTSTPENGSRTNANNVALDGIGITSVSWGGAAIVTPNEDSVKEIKVVSNSYDAENGRFVGAQTQVITQNGTNQYHGSFFFLIVGA